MRLGAWTAVTAACAACLAGSAPAVSNLPSISTAVVVDGAISATATTGSTVVAGGTFTYAGAYTGGFGAVPSGGGTPSSLPAVNGTVNAVVSDGSGGWFVGGTFATVGSATAANLVHLTSTGTLDATWLPSPDGAVNALALSADRSKLYVGGAFATIGGQTRNGLASLTASTGAPTGWNPNANNAVTVVALSPDSGTLYTAGSFTSVGGQSRAGLAAINTTSGAATSWNPAPSATVSALDISSDGSAIYAGGSFATIGGQSRSNIAALSATTGLALSFAPQANGPVTAVRLSPDGTLLYVGGTFSAVGGAVRTNLGAVSTTTGLASAWDPGPDGSILSLGVAASGSPVYAGGSFGNIGGQARSKVAAVSATDATATSWSPGADAAVTTIAVTSSSIAIGGVLSSVGGQPRANLVAFTTSGQILSFAPNPNGAVTALAISPDGTTVYAGGAFTTAGGLARNRLAAIQLSNGLVTSWNPNLNGTVSALAVDPSGAPIYAAGAFTTIGSAPVTTRNRIVAIDATGAPTTWNPNASAVVSALAVSSDGSTVYAGGSFATIGTNALTRNRIAALNSSGAATTWDPNANNTVVALALSPDGTTVYAGGTFTTIGGQTRNRLGALSATTGLATAWNPNVGTTTVSALAVSADGSTVYTGGTFTTIGALTRNRLAAIDATSGVATTWNPNASGAANSLVITANGIVAGGAWTTLGTVATRLPNLASFALDVPVLSVAPAITGTPTVGSSLTCSTGTWTNAPTSFTYSWRLDGVANGTTTSGYTVVAGDLGHALSCKVTATNAEGATSATTAALSIVAPPVNSAAPFVAGTATVGSILTCDPGTWSYSPTFTYQWLRGGSAIGSATSSAYTVTSADAAHVLACQVTATNGAGSASATSAGVTIAAVSSGGSSGGSTGGSTPASPPPAQTPTDTGDRVTQSVDSAAAGSATLASGVNVTWDGGTFAGSASLLVRTLSLAQPIGGFSAKVGVIEVTVTPAGSMVAAPIFFLKPLVLHFPASLSVAGVVPASSHDGVAWSPMPPLRSAALPAGQLDGYFHRPDGGYDLYTRHATLFGLLRDITRPTIPAGIVASLQGNTLHLRWSPAADNSRRIARYEILRDRRRSQTVAGGVVHANIALASLKKTTTFRVRAVDPAGNVGTASIAIRVRVAVRPKAAPARIPLWAIRVAAWEQKPAATRGAKPTTPKPLPKWYRAWSTWSTHRFTLLP